ncbi:hypothetical protein [Brucella sp. IR073]
MKMESTKWRLKRQVRFANHEAKRKILLPYWMPDVAFKASVASDVTLIFSISSGIAAAVKIPAKKQ